MKVEILGSIYFTTSVDCAIVGPWSFAPIAPHRKVQGIHHCDEEKNNSAQWTLDNEGDVEGVGRMN
jgi:hypothetical protein